MMVECPMAKRRHTISWFVFGLAAMFTVKISIEVTFGISLSKFSFGRGLDRSTAAEQFIVPLVLAGVAIVLRAIENQRNA
jgi:hypothetical protein